MRRFAFVRSRAAENSKQTIVAFMASVLIKGDVAGDHRHLGLPGPCEHRRIIDREFVKESVRSRPGEPLDEAEIFVGAPEFAFVGECSRRPGYPAGRPPSAFQFGQQLMGRIRPVPE